MLKRELWRKRLALLWQRGRLYPAPEPLPRTRTFWLATAAVTLAVLCFSVYFILLLFARHDAFQTNAEDLGIMDQAIWSTLHGHPLHQTICNILFDTNCASPDGIMRFAIHFEPILFLISLFYLIWSDPKCLFVIQTVVVATGAYAAFWLARLRLRNNWIAVVIACLYLLYPVLQQAVVSDFHAVTLTASLLLFTFYCMYTRRTILLFLFAVLAMACKEEVPLIVAMIGLWSMLLQRRWLSGGALVLLACAWFLLGYYVIMPHFSPTGHPLLISRYSDVGQSPIGLIKNILFHPRVFFNSYIWEKDHFAYLHILLGPAGYLPKPNGDPLFYLPMLAPWAMILAAPVIVLNLVSSNPQMYSGLFHYSAEIVPVIIFSVIEALVLIVWLVQLCVLLLARAGERAAQAPEIRARRAGIWAHTASGVLLALLSVGMLGSAIRSDYYFHGQLPFSQGFSWPQASSNQSPAHLALAQRFIAQVPEDASVSVQTKIVPHMSHRNLIYMFPYQDTRADYVLLDVTSDIYPYASLTEYTNEVKRLLLSGHYGVVAGQDGYLLLKRGVPAPGISSTSPVRPDQEGDATLASFNLPPDFCSNLYVAPQQVRHPLNVSFSGPTGGSMSLVGYEYSGSDSLSKATGYVHLTSYWRVERPITTPLQMIVLIQDVNGKEYLVSNDVPEMLWCESNTWRTGSIIRVTSRDFHLQEGNIPTGLAHLSIALLPLVYSSSTMMDVQARLSLRILNAPGTVTTRRGTDALQLMPLTIVE